ncbi:copper amine oxidase [Aspergillus floccosus]
MRSANVASTGCDCPPSGPKNRICRPHPLDPLSVDEITLSASLMREHFASDRLKFNCITLHEPSKSEYAAFRAGTLVSPDRRSFAIIIQKTNEVCEVVTNLTQRKVETCKTVRDVIALQTPDEEAHAEDAVRQDPRVAEACREIGITDMSTVYFDTWSIGYNEHWGTKRRLLQAIPYYRASALDNQYAHPLDFTVLVDRERKEVVSVNVRRVHGERTLVPTENHNYHPQFLREQYRWDRLRPILTTQPYGVSFHLHGHELHWAALKLHVGFNYREGIVLSDVRMEDFSTSERRERMLFNRISVAEMVVPYAHRNAFDVGEYGTGVSTNSLRLGCDCNGVIQYLDAVLSSADGTPYVIKNAICIHEEDNGLLYKHTDERDNTVVLARDRKLIISQIMTAANHEYAFYHTFTLDGTYRCEVRLTGIPSTSSLHPLEPASPSRNEVAKGVDAPNHQHIFSLRVDPSVDGNRNTVVQNDNILDKDASSDSAFYTQKTTLRTARSGASDYCHETGRTWDIINPHRINPRSKKPVAYRIINNDCPPLLARPGGRLAKRAAFARHSLWVVPYQERQIFPAGQYVCQRSGDVYDPDNTDILDWTARDECIEDADIVCYIQFGVIHVPRTEDFPIMPAETVGVTLRASNFFQQNPALWVPPSGISRPGACQAADSNGASQCREALETTSGNKVTKTQENVCLNAVSGLSGLTL